MQYQTKKYASPATSRIDAFCARVNRNLARQGISLSVTPETTIVPKTGTEVALKAVFQKYEDSPMGTWSAEDQFVEEVLSYGIRVRDDDGFWPSMDGLDYIDYQDQDVLAESHDAWL